MNDKLIQTSPQEGELSRLVDILTLDSEALQDYLKKQDALHGGIFLSNNEALGVIGREVGQLVQAQQRGDESVQQTLNHLIENAEEQLDLVQSLDERLHKGKEGKQNKI
jgi:hypothetical protein